METIALEPPATQDEAESLRALATDLESLPRTLPNKTRTTVAIGAVRF